MIIVIILPRRPVDPVAVRLAAVRLVVVVLQNLIRHGFEQSAWSELCALVSYLKNSINAINAINAIQHNQNQRN